MEGPSPASPPAVVEISSLAAKPRCLRYRSSKKSSKKVKRHRGTKRASKRKRKARRARSKRLKKKAKKGIEFEYALSGDATVTVSIRRRSKSHTRRACPVGRSKTKPKHGHIAQPGTYREVGSFTLSGRSGENSANVSVLKKARTARSAFSQMGKSGRNTAGVASGLNLKKLKAGTYKAYVTVFDSAGNASSDAVVKFWVLKRR